MTNTEEPQNSAHEQPETGHVGHQLRRAREVHGLSITQVADNQHLRPAVIQSIEDGDYDKIGSELFLKGYVKAYAEQVELAPAPLLQQLNRELEPLRREAEAAEYDNPLETIERKKRRKRRIARWVITIVVVCAIGYVVFRVFETEILTLGASEAQSQKASETQGQAPISSDEPVSEPENVISGSGSDNGAVERSSQAGAAEDQLPAVDSESQQGSLMQDTDSSALNNETNLGEEADQGGNNVPESGEDAQVTSDLSAAPESVQNTANDSDAANTADQAGDVLQVEFTGNCWVSVENGDGEKVVASLKRAGETLHYQGKGPFRVVLGAADTASVTFNGDVVDLSQYPASSNRVALTLGQ